MNMLKEFDPSLAEASPTQRLSRDNLFAKVEPNFDNLKRVAADRGWTYTQAMQALAPHAEANRNEDCGRDYLQSKGVYVEDSIEKGIVSTNVMDLADQDKATQNIYHHYMLDQQRLGLKSLQDKQREVVKFYDALQNGHIQDNLSEFEKGSIMRQWQDFVNFQSHSAFPRFEAVIGRVLNSRGSAPRVNENKIYNSEELLRQRDEGTQAYVNSLNYIENSVTMTDKVVGFTWTRKQATDNGFNSAMLADAQQQAGILVAEAEMKAAIELMVSNGALSTKRAVASTKAGLETAILAAPDRYTWTSVFGRKATIQRYLDIDRSSFYAGSRELPIGGAIGSDFYARSPLPRYVADVPDDWGIAANDILLVDARFAIDLYSWFAFEFNTTSFNDMADRYYQLRTISTGVAERFPSLAAGSKPFELMTLTP